MPCRIFNRILLSGNLQVTVEVTFTIIKYIIDIIHDVSGNIR